MVTLADVTCTSKTTDAMLEKLKAGRLAERVASVDPGTQISGKREGATLSRSSYSACGTEIKRNKEK